MRVCVMGMIAGCGRVSGVAAGRRCACEGAIWRSEAVPAVSVRSRPHCRGCVVMFVWFWSCGCGCVVVRLCRRRHVRVVMAVPCLVPCVWCHGRAVMCIVLFVLSCMSVCPYVCMFVCSYVCMPYACSAPNHGQTFQLGRVRKNPLHIIRIALVPRLGARTQLLKRADWR